MHVSEPTDAVEVERCGWIQEVELPGVVHCLALEGERKRDIMDDPWVFVLSSWLDGGWHPLLR